MSCIKLLRSTVYLLLILRPVHGLKAVFGPRSSEIYTNIQQRWYLVDGQAADTRQMGQTLPGSAKLSVKCVTRCPG